MLKLQVNLQKLSKQTFKMVFHSINPILIRVSHDRIRISIAGIMTIFFDISIYEDPLNRKCEKSIILNSQIYRYMNIIWTYNGKISKVNV